MKINTLKISLLLIILSFFFNAKAQDTLNIRRSNNEVTINGSKYYIHIVKRGQTLFRIAKAYNVTVQQIEDENFNIKVEELHIGQPLKIPVIKRIKQTKPIVKPKYHIVDSGQTVYSIAQMYRLRVDQIYSLNPDAKQAIYPGQKLYLPNNTINNSYIDTLNTNNIVNKVKPNYNINTDTCTCPEDAGLNNIKIGIFLPFYTNINDTLTNSVGSPIVYNSSLVSIDFYEGILLAIDKLSKTGLNIDLSVYDTQNNPEKVRELAKLDIFKYFNLIIGPLYGTNLCIIKDAAKQYNIPIVSPLSTNSKFLNNYKFAFQVSPNKHLLNELSIKAIKKFKTDNYILIKNGEAPNKEFESMFESKLFKGKTEDEISHLRYSTVTYFPGDKELNMDSFVDTIRNFAIIPSNNKAFVSDIIGRLNTLSKTYDITVLGNPRWVNFENIDLKFLHNLNTYILNLNYIDYNKNSVKKFVKKYRLFYNKEPEKYAFFGYDIAYYFIHAIQLFGNNFYCCFDNYYPELLQMQFDFKRESDNSGYINHKLILMNYRRDYIYKPADIYNK